MAKTINTYLALGSSKLSKSSDYITSASGLISVIASLLIYLAKVRL